jgi:hypothetical protein
VDAQPLQALIHDWFLPDDGWERRYDSKQDISDVIYRTNLVGCSL